MRIIQPWITTEKKRKWDSPAKISEPNFHLANNVTIETFGLK